MDLGRWICCPWCVAGEPVKRDLGGTWYHDSDGWQRPCPISSRGEAVHSIDWIIVGGESGHGARPMHPDWARSLRDQCQSAGVAFHFKQWGEYADPGQMELVEPGDYDRQQRHFDIGPRMTLTVLRVGKHAAGRLLDGRTWDEFPR